MNRFLSIVFVLLLIFPLQASAEELPKALGITFGGSIDDVKNAYKGKGDTSNTIRWLEPYYSVTYNYPLVNLRDAGKITYFVFREKVYSCSLKFTPKGKYSVLSRSKEIQSNLTTKYGDQTRCSYSKGEDNIFVAKCWHSNNLEISHSTPSSDKQNIIKLIYTYLPLEKAYKEYLQQEEIDGL